MLYAPSVTTPKGNITEPDMRFYEKKEVKQCGETIQALFEHANQRTPNRCSVI